MKIRHFCAAINEMLDRKTPPSISTDFNLAIKNVSSIMLGSGITIHEVNTGTQDITKVELIFKCGRVNEEHIAAARATANLLGEGTSSHTSAEIDEHFDFYGAIVKFRSALESTSISLVCLNRHFQKVWPMFYSVIFDPLFDEKEVKKYADVASQKLRNQISKNEIISYRVLTEKIFGKDHPYGYNTQPEDIASLKAESIKNFYNKNFSIENAFIVLSGKYDDKIKQRITSDFERAKKESSMHFQSFYAQDFSNKTFNEKTQNDSQVSIKMGRMMFERKHKHFSHFYFLNTILGGYFGSRLMKNIREDKGYTYGIYSSLDAYKQNGVFYISSEVGNDFVNPCITEIYNEIDTLKSTLVNEEEMSMVRNYLLGQSLHLIDGPFATGHLIKNIYSKDLEISDFENHINIIRNITSVELREIANLYLDKNTFTTVLAGYIT